jgi:hypothetical protein
VKPTPPRATGITDVGEAPFHPLAPLSLQPLALRASHATPVVEHGPALLFRLGRGFWMLSPPKANQIGFLSMAHEARTDFCVLLGGVFLLIVGAGYRSLPAFAWVCSFCWALLYAYAARFTSSVPETDVFQRGQSVPWDSNYNPLMEHDIMRLKQQRSLDL